METIWTFDTKHFRVAFEAIPEDDLDLSWDDDGSVQKGLETGQYVAFTARVAVYLKNTVAYDKIALGVEYLGNCIYESTYEFRTLHRGCGYRGPTGGYFPDMVRGAIAAARKNLRQPRIYVRPNA